MIDRSNEPRHSASLRNGRRALATLLAIAVLGIVILAAAAMANHMAREIGRERLDRLDAHYEQAVQSVRLWCRLHGEELSSSESLDLPLDSILPAGWSADATVCRMDHEPSIVRCDIRLTDGLRSLTRREHWPVPLRTSAEMP